MLKQTRINWLVRLIDMAGVVVALYVAAWLRLMLPFGAGSEASDGTSAFGTPALLVPISILIWQIAFQLTHVYRAQLESRGWERLRALVAGQGLAALLFLGILYLTYRDYSRLQSGYMVLGTGVILGGYRLLSGLMGRRGRTGNRSETLVLIVGTDANAFRVGKTVAQYQWMGFHVLGYLRLDAVSESDAVPEKEIIGRLSELSDLLDQHPIGELIIASGWEQPDAIADWLPVVQRHPVNIRLAPDYSDLAYFRVQTENFGGIPLIALRAEVLTSSQRFWKRAFDLTLAGTVLLFGWPLFGIIALAIWLDDGHPVVIRQERAGERARLFEMIKFRTMYQNSPPPSSKLKQRDDPRVTRVGRFLRRTSLDELPQFVNILRGDMSVVGPRPEMPWIVRDYEPWQCKRFEVPQGLTGWWQISGRADRPMHLHIEDDLFYIQHYSLLFDLQIVLRTVLVVIIGRGAY